MRRARRVEGDRQGRVSRGRVGREHRRRRHVLDAVDAAPVQIHVEEVAPRPGHQLHRRPGAGHEGLAAARIRNRRWFPGASPRCSGASSRRRRGRSCTPRGRSLPCRRRAPRSRSCPSGTTRPTRPARCGCRYRREPSPHPPGRTGPRRDSGSDCRSLFADPFPRSRASRSWSGSPVLPIRSISSHVLHPTSPTQISPVPGRIVKRNGLRRPWATMRRALGSELEKSGLPESPAPVAGSTRISVPSSVTGSPELPQVLRAQRAPFRRRRRLHAADSDRADRRRDSTGLPSCP